MKSRYGYTNEMYISFFPGFLNGKFSNIEAITVLFWEIQELQTTHFQ